MSSRTTGLVICILLSLGRMGLAQTTSTQPEKLRDRYSFAASMAKLHAGMSADEIRRILGPPDDVETETDPEGVHRRVDAREIWRYGTNGHLTCATLGQVYISQSGQAQEVYGGRGTPPPAGMFEESQLRDLLRVIDQSPVPGQGNPRTLIASVNSLEVLGKEKALAALSEYARISGGFDGGRQVFLILRVLFEVPDNPGYIPTMAIGAPQPALANARQRFPRYPIIIVDDVPLNIAGGYMLGGRPESPIQDIPQFNRYALRTHPLLPSDHPLAVYDQAIKLFSAKESESLKMMLADQILQLVDTVYRPPNGTENQRLDYLHFDAQWDSIYKDLGKLDIRWHAASDRYVFSKDGSALPDRIKELHFRQVIRPAFGRDDEIVVQRYDSNQVEIGVSRSLPARPSLLIIRVYAWNPTNSDPPKLIATEVEDKQDLTAERGGMSTGYMEPIPQGWRVRVELQCGDQEKRGDAWIP